MAQSLRHRTSQSVVVFSKMFRKNSLHDKKPVSEYDD